MSVKRKRLLLATAAAGALLLGASGVVATAATRDGGPASVLSSLVSDGTLTQEQADKVLEGLRKQHEEMRAEREAHYAQMRKVITDTLGISEEQLEQAGKDGKTLAQIAGAKKQQLITALTGAIQAHIDEAVSEGKITADQAKLMKANAATMAKRMINTKPGLGPGMGPGGPGGHMGPGGPGGMGFGGMTGPGGASSPTASVVDSA